MGFVKGIHMLNVDKVYIRTSRATAKSHLSHFARVAMNYAQMFKIYQMYVNLW